MGLTPTIAASPQLMATSVYYLPGTKIGEVRTPVRFETFGDAMIAASDAPGGGTKNYIDYPASIWPFSTGGLNDPKWNDSVATGLADLTDADPQAGGTVFGFSQGAVVATEYKRAQPGSGINYVLVENPNRPNGGVLERFNGLNVPILDISFNGATPVEDPSDTTGKTVDISRQYDGWSDFPAYPLNLLATANAIAGIYHLHGDTQNFGADALDGIDTTDGNTMYYQVHGDTTYYLIPTDRLPLLMPFDGIVPDPVLDAVDKPLRVVVELGYDRGDYSTPTPAGIAPTVNPLTVANDLTTATVQVVQTGLDESGVSTPAIAGAKIAQAPTVSTPNDLNITRVLPKLPNAPKPDVLKSITPKPRITTSPLASPLANPLVSKLATPSGTAKAGNAGPVKSIQSALKSLAPKNLAPKPKPADNDPSE